MKYKIYDNQLYCFAFNNKIFDSEKEAIDYLLNYFDDGEHTQKDLLIVEKEFKINGEYADLEIWYYCSECGKDGDLEEWGLENPKDDTCLNCKKIRKIRRLKDKELENGK